MELLRHATFDNWDGCSCASFYIYISSAQCQASYIYQPDIFWIADNVCRLSISIVRLLDCDKIRNAHVLKHLDISKASSFVGEIHANGRDARVADGSQQSNVDDALEGCDDHGRGFRFVGVDVDADVSHTLGATSMLDC